MRTQDLQTLHYEIVLIHPEIAGNTGNIGRSCMALGCRLHLVHPLGYRISDSSLKRAGLDYWPRLDLREHENLDAWMSSIERSREVWLLSTKAEKNWDPSEVGDGATLVFGSESSGLPEEVRGRWRERQRGIPIHPKARSLNLSACVAMVLGSLILRSRLAPASDQRRHGDH